MGKSTSKSSAVLDLRRTRSRMKPGAYQLEYTQESESSEPATEHARPRARVRKVRVPDPGLLDPGAPSLRC